MNPVKSTHKQEGDHEVLHDGPAGGDGGGPPRFLAGPPEKMVRMTDSNSFEPQTMTVKPGETVVWKNVSTMSHSVTDISSLAVEARDAPLPANAKEFNSDLIPPGKDWSHTFTVPGTYKYFCIPHEALGMIGTVIVSK